MPLFKHNIVKYYRHIYDNFLQIDNFFTDKNSLSFSTFGKQTHPAGKGELRKPK